MNAEAEPLAEPGPKTSEAPALAEAPEWPRHTFTTAQIAEMLDAQILHDDDPVEFLKGELHPVSPQSAPHANLFSRLYRLLGRRYPDTYWLTGQVPLVCGVNSLPEPDLLVLRNDDCQVEDRHPRSDEVTLVIEVARTSHQRDHWKAGLYAEGGIPEYWLIDLPARRIEVYQDPRPAEACYGALRILSVDDSLKLPELDQAILVADIFPT
jgi:Uma2 family endonuclease